MKSCHKLSKSCNIHGKNREISGFYSVYFYSFWTSIKNNIPDVWNWICRAFFLFGSWSVGDHSPPGPPNGYAPGMGGVLCIAIVSERLKIRKSLRIHYWQDTISSVKVNNNVINVYKLWGVSTSFVTLCYFSLYFWFIKNRGQQKSWGRGGGAAAAPQHPRFLRAWSNDVKYYVLSRSITIVSFSFIPSVELEI